MVYMNEVFKQLEAEFKINKEQLASSSDKLSVVRLYNIFTELASLLEQGTVFSPEKICFGPFTLYKECFSLKDFFTVSIAIGDILILTQQYEPIMFTNDTQLTRVVKSHLCEDEYKKYVPHIICFQQYVFKHADRIAKDKQKIALHQNMSIIDYAIKGVTV